MQLTREAYRWLQGQIKSTNIILYAVQTSRLNHLGIAKIRLTKEELKFLKTACPFLSKDFLHFLSNLQLNPADQVVSTFEVKDDSGRDSDKGDLHIVVKGRWVDTILYEIPLLALTSEAYFRFCDVDWDHAKQEGWHLTIPVQQD
jgi:nicotinate phosphoribosyltransferase